jgi:hypothetical protein
MSVRAAMQLRIDAQQAHDAIDYALRSVRECGGSVFCTGVHAVQLEAGRAAAASIGSVVGYNNGDRWTDRVKSDLIAAKKDAAELVKAAKADLKAIGGVRQLRLALATGDGHEYALAA